MKTAVLFLVFNRPDTTQIVFEQIRRAKPPRLYVAADGPRDYKSGEEEKCAQTRKIATAVDWDCELKTLFRSENLGCRNAVSGAINWFFEHEEMGIILEDDCIPVISFFRFCEELLVKYLNNANVMHINGNNFGIDLKNIGIYPESYSFTRMPQVWGWATWRRAWGKNDIELKELDLNRVGEDIVKAFRNRNHLDRQLKRWELAKEGEIDTWDFQWQYAVISKNGLAIVPELNLIRNIGFGEEATHTSSTKNLSANIKTHELSFPLRHPEVIKPDLKIDKWYQKNMLGPVTLYGKIYNKLMTLIKIA